MVMEHAPGDVKRLLGRVRPLSLSQAEVKLIMLQLLSALAYLHGEQRIVHRDIKPSNLLLSDSLHLKVCDFGMSKQVLPAGPQTPSSSSNGSSSSSSSSSSNININYNSNSDGSCTTPVCTLWYRAPELLLGLDHHCNRQSIDMWSAGCTFAELLTTRPLFPGSDELDQINQIFRTLGTPTPGTWADFAHTPLGRTYSWPVHSPDPGLSGAVHFAKTGGTYLSSGGLDLLEKMVCYNPDVRITAQEALRHPWFEEQPLPAALEVGSGW